MRQSRPVRFGLDFGTSNTSVALWDGERSTVLPIDPLAGAAMPTVLYVRRDGSSLVGRPAIEAYLADNRQRGPVTREFKPLGIRLESSNPRQKTVEAMIYTDTSSPGRLFQALKTFLGDPLDVSTNVFGEARGLEDLIAGCRACGGRPSSPGSAKCVSRSSLSARLTQPRSRPDSRSSSTSAEARWTSRSCAARE